MQKAFAARPRSNASLRLLAAAAAAAFLLVPGPSARSEDQGAPSEPIVRVEEQWVLALNQPDNSFDSPQFHTVMSPTDNLDGVSAQVTWNYRDVPDFIGGGIQVQLWNGEELVQFKNGREDSLSRSTEMIRWTQVLETNGESLTFRIENGTSTTWGSFGEGLNLTVAGGAANLNAYSPSVSVRNSCITYGSNRVNALAIVQVRYYGKDGLVAVDENPKVVFLFGATGD